MGACKSRAVSNILSDRKSRYFFQIQLHAPRNKYGALSRAIFSRLLNAPIGLGFIIVVNSAIIVSIPVPSGAVAIFRSLIELIFGDAHTGSHQD